MPPQKEQAGCSVEPLERLKLLINYSNAIEVDFNIPPTRYYRSGLEMVRMANVYYTEGSLENAYVLYLKFMTLFLEKIRKHPGFNAVPSKVKVINQAKLREVFPKAEKLKEELLQQYQVEYSRYIADLKEKQRQEKNRKVVPAPATNNESQPKSKGGKTDSSAFVDVLPPPSVNNIQYPDPNIPSASVVKKPETIISEKEVGSIPSVDRTTKPSEIYSSTYSKRGLRTVIVPSKVIGLFQNLAQKNTVNNIETCGILAGKLEQNELTITHIILPKQKGTSDSCMTMNEEEIFDYQDTKSLITIGWIHTHPTQTAFLSSVDLHTHCPYQLLMPEAIAIVCAPRYNETGFFVLTPSYGLDFIANCRKTGFHPHPTEPPLFMVAEHVKINHDAALEVVDLRL